MSELAAQEQYCPECGCKVLRKAEICPNCGVRLKGTFPIKKSGFLIAGYLCAALSILVPILSLVAIGIGIYLIINKATVHGTAQIVIALIVGSVGWFIAGLIESF